MAGQQTVHDGNEDVSWEDQVRNDDLKKQAQRELLQTSDEDLDVDKRLDKQIQKEISLLETH
jgi:hypothetical protein